jgi:hypothetical protein
MVTSCMPVIVDGVMLDIDSIVKQARAILKDASASYRDTSTRLPLVRCGAPS